MAEPSRDPAGLRVDQIGSLLRPEDLKAAYARHARGEAPDEELRQAQDDAIRRVVGQQEARRYPIVTDGEYRRVNFQDSLIACVSGFAPPSDADRAAREWNPGYSGPLAPGALLRRPAIERIRLVRNLPLREYLFARSIATHPIKVTLLSPDRVLQRFAYERSRSVYPDPAEFVGDLVDILRRMVEGLVQAGCRYVQVDAPSYTAYVDPPSLEEMRARGEDPVANMERGIQADNAVIAGFPGVTFGLHICRGNQASRWHREGHYDAIAERLFSSLHHQRLLLEYDTERAGSFEPLRSVPKGKMVVLGLVSTKVPELESADHLKRRIEAASRFIPMEQLALSPQCGFASDIGGNLLSEDDQWRKLELVQEVAAQVWGEP